MGSVVCSAGEVRQHLPHIVWEMGIRARQINQTPAQTFHAAAQATAL